MGTITVAVPPAPYPVEVTTGLIAGLGPRLAATLTARRLLLVTDPVAGSLFGEVVLPSLAAAGFEVRPATLWGGEAAKNLATVEALCRQCAVAGLGRDGAIVALGGGTVTDVAGFAAATWNRGIAWAAVPTTLLAQVDAAIGGKTGVNLPEGKNLVGAFHQPRVVLCDPAALRTLPVREVRSGLAEVVKAGLIGDPDLFAACERQAAALLAREPEALAPVVEAAIAVKARLVAADEREAGTRAWLNLGHTLGHAVEAATGYGPVRHGEAVAIGIAAACRIAVARRLLDRDTAVRIGAALVRLGLPVEAPADLDLPAVARALATDKKARDGVVRWVLPRDIGTVEVLPDAGEAADPGRWLSGPLA